MDFLDELGVIVDRAIGRWILNKRTKSRACLWLALFRAQARGMRYSKIEFAEIAYHNLDSERLRPGLDDGNCLGMTIIGNKERLAIWNDSVTKRHRFGSSRRFVEHGSVRDVEGGQIYDHLLEVQQRFEPPLREFRLVRRVSGIPAGVFKNIALNDRRRDAVVIASADERPREFILLCNRPQFSQRFAFRFPFR